MDRSEIGLFIEKYRPQSLEEYVGNERIKQKFSDWIEKDEIPHLLFHGKAGTGKTTMAKILVNNIDCDSIYINASDENNVETVRNKIKGFASTIGFRSWKIIVLDEADYLTPNAQAILRNLMETFADRTRFILTCNYPDKVIEAIKSRCQSFKIEPPSKKDIAKRLLDICKKEGLEIKPEALKIVVDKNYPDIRRMQGVLQANIRGDKIILDDDTLGVSEIDEKIIETLNKNTSIKDRFNAIRQLMLDEGKSEYSDLYKNLYENIDEYGKGNKASIILHINEAQYKDSFVVDKEINAMALIIKILDIIG